MFDFSNPIFLVVASLLVGVSVGLAAFAASAQLKAHGLVEELERSGRGDANRPGLVGAFMPFGTALGRVLGLKGVRATLTEGYARAGYPDDMTDDEVLGKGVILGFFMATPVVMLIALIDWRFVPAGFLLALMGPGLLSSSYSSMGDKRERAISRVMPFVLDLLVLTMRAGSSLQQSLKQVAADYEEHPIGVEFRAVLADLATGTTTKEAFLHFHERVPIDAVGLFVDDLIMGEELGRPLAEVFERQADQSRVRRVQDAMDTAGKAKVMVLVPGMLVFVAVLILLFAPFALRWWYGTTTVNLDLGGQDPVTYQESTSPGQLDSVAYERASAPPHHDLSAS